MSIGLKTWDEHPSESEIKDAVHQFFTYLKNGELDVAESYVEHAYEDWLDTLFVMWEDHYLIHEIPKDSSFEGKEWLTDLNWLKDLDIDEDDFNLYPADENSQNTSVDVGFQYRDEPSGYGAAFTIQKNESGKYYLERELIGMS